MGWGRGAAHGSQRGGSRGKAYDGSARRGRDTAASSIWGTGKGRGEHLGAGRALGAGTKGGAGAKAVGEPVCSGHDSASAPQPNNSSSGEIGRVVSGRVRRDFHALAATALASFKRVSRVEMDATERLVASTTKDVGGSWRARVIGGEIFVKILHQQARSVAALTARS